MGEGGHRQVRANPGAEQACRCHDRVVAVRLLIVDDHAGFRAMARLVFEAARFDVVGEAVDAASAVRAVRVVRAVASLRPSVVLLDVALPDSDGFDVCERSARHTTRRPSCSPLAGTPPSTPTGWR